MRSLWFGGWTGSTIALAALAPAATQACGLTATVQAVATHAVAGDSFELSDGRMVKLASVIAPGSSLSLEPAGRVEQARQTLDRLVAGRLLDLHVVSEGDRYGRLVAHAGAPGGDGTSVEADLLAAGQARLLPSADPCRERLRAAETVARSARLGVWGDPYYSVKAAADGDALTEAEGDFLVAEGSVTDVGADGTRVYLNFAPSRTNGLSVTVWKGHFDKFPEGESGLKRLAGVRVRVRGWIWSRSRGAVLPVVAADQIERLDSIGTDAR